MSDVQSASGLTFTIPPWPLSISIFLVVALVTTWSRRSPVIHPSRLDSARLSGCTFLISQQSLRFSTLSYIGSCLLALPFLRLPSDRESTLQLEFHTFL